MIKNKKDKVTRRLKYDRWYRKYGIWNINQFKTPNVYRYANIVLPERSILHWVDYLNVYDVAPNFDETIIKNTCKKIYVEVIDKYAPDARGGWHHINAQTASLFTQYIKSHPKILRPTKPIHLINELDYLPVFSYGFLDNLHKYEKKRTSELFRWQNYHYTVLHNVAKIAMLSDRQQFIELDVPVRYPTRDNLRKCINGIDEHNLTYVNNKNMWLIVEFWNFLSPPDPKTGVKPYSFIFQNIDKDVWDKVNIIWRIDDKYICTNIGIMMGLVADDDPKHTKLIALRRAFLKLMINLKTVREMNEEEQNAVEQNIDYTPNKHNVIDDENDEDAPIGILDDDSNDDDDVNSSFDDSQFIKANKRMSTSPVDVDRMVENPDDIVLDDEVEEQEEDNLDSILNEVAEDTSVEDAVYQEYKPGATDAKDILETETNKLVKAGIMSTGSKQRLLDMLENSYGLDSPISANKSIGEDMVISKEDIIIEPKNRLPVESKDILDESMKYSSLNKLNKQYITKVMQKDVLNSVMNIQKGGLVIKEYSTEEIETINDHFVIHKVQIETLKGHVSTLSFKLPVVKPDGTFISNGTKRILRSQRGDVPIRKVDYNSVALTSYYSKMFVNRSIRKQFDIESYVVNHINTSAIENTNGITDVKLNDVFDGQLSGFSRQFTTLSKHFSQFTVNGVTLHFDWSKNQEIFKTRIRALNRTPLGVNAKGETVLYINHKTSQLYNHNNKELNKTLYEYIGIDEDSLPYEHAEVSIFGKNFPLIAVLGHQLGFGNLLKTLKLKPRREARGKRLKLEKGEYEIKFSDETLIFNRLKDDPKALLIVNGLLRFKNVLKSISVYDLDGKSVYSDLFDEIKAPLKLLKESKDMFNMWVDPITFSILEEMNEPTDLVMLFIRACELLTTDEHPDAMDTLYMRDKGYERMAGILYGELTKAVREYNSKPIYSQQKLTMNPESVWFAITTDQTQTLVEESNPIHNLKESEVVVYSGSGGRSGQTMMASSRKFHKNSLGTTAENTVDSGDAGVIVYKTADPGYNSVRGTSRKQDIETLTPTQTFSTSFMLAPGANMNDAKRTNFVSTQNSQTTFCTGYTPMPLRTGMEKVIHTRTGSMFSKIADLNGTVVNVTKDSILVQYDDGTKEGFKIGRRYGKWGGYNVPHDLVANVKKGDKFKAGDCLYFNSNYFTKDITDDGNIMFKNFVLGRVALVENFDTYEDSCAMSKKFSNKLISRLGHIRNVRITTDKTIKNLVKVGDAVETDSMLCTIHSVQLGGSLFNDDSLKSLESIAALNPKAGNKGIIDDIKIIYTAELDDMGDELRELVEEYDSKLYQQSKTMNSKIRNGRVDPGFLVDGVGLSNDEVVIQIYITETADMSVADKVVIGNQLKSTVGRYWIEDVTSEDGQEIDILFGANSVDNRIVLDCDLIGTTNALLVALSDEVVKAYNK